MKNSKPNRAFLVRMARDENDITTRIESVKRGIIAVGWGRASEAINQNTWASFKTVVRDAYPHLQTSNQKLGSAAGSLWRFIKENSNDAITTGDYIILPCHKTFYIGICESEPFYSQDQWAIENDFAWQRKVKWLNNGKPFSRLSGTAGLQSRLKARQTCVDASDLINDIEMVLKNPEKINFASKLLEDTKTAISGTIINHVNPDQLERLVEQLCKRSGAKVSIPNKNSSSNGDVDVIADYPVSIGFEKKIVRVLYQVKRHKPSSETSSHAINQVVDRMTVMMDEKTDENVIQHIGCVVTTAEKLTEAAYIKADDECIEIICLDKLIEWILKVGIEGIEL